MPHSVVMDVVQASRSSEFCIDAVDHAAGGFVAGVEAMVHSDTFCTEVCILGSR